MLTIKKEISAKIIVASFILLTIWWITLRFMNLPPESYSNQLFAAVYGVIALGGGILGIGISRKWGGFHSIMGKSLFFFAIGLLFQEIGQLAYSYYIYFLHIPVPYPSVGDVFFYITIPIYTLAVIYLARASGIRISLKALTNKIQAIIIPLVMLALSYFLFLQKYEFDWSSPLTVFLDFAVPLGQAIYISLALLTYLLTKRVLGGVMKNKVLFILFALVAQFAADWTFLYQASIDTWYAGGINDYMFLCAYFIMTVGLLQFKTIYNRLQENKKA